MTVSTCSRSLLQLVFPGENCANFPWEKSHWDNTVCSVQLQFEVSLTHTECILSSHLHFLQFLIPVVCRQYRNLRQIPLTLLVQRLKTSSTAQGQNAPKCQWLVRYFHEALYGDFHTDLVRFKPEVMWRSSDVLTMAAWSSVVCLLIFFQFFCVRDQSDRPRCKFSKSRRMVSCSLASMQRILHCRVHLQLWYVPEKWLYRHVLPSAC